MSLIIAWETKRDNQGVSGGFYTRCAPTLAGAIHNNKTLTSGKQNDYWEFRVGKVKGRLIWIDKTTGDFGYQLKAAFINEAGDKIHVINQSYNAGNAATLVGKIKNLAKQKVNILTDFIELTFSVYQKKDFNTKALKYREDGSPDVKSELSLSSNGVAAKDWFVYADKTKTAEERADMGAKPIEMEWKKFKNSKGKDDWNTDVEDKFWDEAIKSLQKYLITNNACVLPLSFSSVICGAEDNATGVKQDNDFIAIVKNLYTSSMAEHNWHWSNKQVKADTSADDFDPYQTTRKSGEEEAKNWDNAMEQSKADLAADHAEQLKRAEANKKAMEAQAPQTVVDKFKDQFQIVPTNPIVVPDGFTKMNDSEDLPF